jgi:hypothetical protein
MFRKTVLSLHIKLKNKDMNKFFKQKSKCEIACYFIAALSIIIGEAVKDILHNTVALEIGHRRLLVLFYDCRLRNE